MKKSPEVIRHVENISGALAQAVLGHVDNYDDGVMTRAALGDKVRASVAEIVSKAWDSGFIYGTAVEITEDDEEFDVEFLDEDDEEEDEQ